MKKSLFLTCLACLALAGCNDEEAAKPGELSSPCQSHSECIETLQCQEGACAPLFHIEQACKEDRECETNLCHAGRCAVHTNPDVNEPECSFSKPCTEGFCVNGKCEDKNYSESCLTDDTCSEGLECLAAKCLIPAKADDRCDVAHVFCVEGECQDGVCTLSIDAKDTDGDTIADAYDKCDVDTDGDTTPDCQDLDSDNDTIPDSVEARNGGDLMKKPASSSIPFLYDFISLDSDNNGIPDMYEGCPDSNFPYTGPESPKPTAVCDNPVDSDNDTIPDYIAQDNDGDGVLDRLEIMGVTTGGAPGRKCGDEPCAPGTAESPWDSDNDTIPDYMDKDSDNDTISDNIEGISDSDSDGVLDRYSLDSDSDTIPDAKEVDEAGAPLVYNQNSTTYCFQSVDCDRDSVRDNDEPICDGVWGIIKPDTDEDGYMDASEITAGQYAVENGLLNGTPITDPHAIVCNPELVVTDVLDFYFELPYEGEEKNALLEFVPKVSKLDLVFNVDTTSSMDETILNVKTNINNIINHIREQVPDSGFALVNFDDFPVLGYASLEAGDLPFRVLGKVSTDKDTVVNYTANPLFTTRKGADGPESGVEALHHIVTGAGVCWKDLETKDVCLDDNVNAPDTWGGVDFRKDTLPVIIHVSDNATHDDDFMSYDKSRIPEPHYTPELLKAVDETGARIIPMGIYVDKYNAREKGVKWATESNAFVPACAFPESKCTMGTFEQTPSVIQGKADQCVLYYEGGHNDVATFISTGVEALVKYGSYEVSTSIEGEEIEGSTMTTACFIKKVVATAYVAPPNEPEKSCNPVAQPTQVNNAGYNNGFTNFSPGTSSATREGARLHFTVYAQNDNCVKPTKETQVFRAYIDVINPTTGLTFGRRQVSIIVPGSINTEQVN